MSDAEKAAALEAYRKAIRQHDERSEDLKKCAYRFLTSVRLSIRDLEKEYGQTEEDIKALQSVGQIIGEVLCELDPERCTCVLLTQTL